MIFDMHCHTSGGSPDSTVKIEENILLLRKKGYNGMLVSDHNSYNGYKSLQRTFSDFTVLRGIEYDSLDGGHLLIILPSHIKYDIFEYRGMAVRDVLKIVHVLGGIVGPAHPYDFSKLGICNTKFKDDTVLLSQFDFIETFNGCLNYKGSVLSEHLARKLDKPCFGGSDSHSYSKVGLGYTKFPKPIKNEDDLISCVLESNFHSLEVGGSFFERKHEKLHAIGVITGGFLYSILNRSLSINHAKKSSLILSALGYCN